MAFINYSIINSPQVDFCSLFYPILKPTLSNDSEFVPLEDFLCGEMLKLGLEGSTSSPVHSSDERILDIDEIKALLGYHKDLLLGEIWKAGFGGSTSSPVHSSDGRILNIDVIKAFWENHEEMLTMQGMYPLLINNQIYIIEDRQNEYIFAKRNECSKQSFRFHLNSECLYELQNDTDLAYDKYKDCSDDYALGYRFRNNKPFSIRQIKNLLNTRQKRLNKKTNSVRFNATYGEAFTVPANVTSLADTKFYLYPNLTRVEFAPGCQLKKIDDFSFSNCKLLREVILPESLEEIGNHAFESCNKLCSLYLPKRLKEIGDSAFAGCQELMEAKIPEGVKKIKCKAFQGCDKLSSLDLPKELEEIGTFAFLWCYKLTEVKIPEGVKEIEDGTFCTCKKLSTVVLHDGVKKIGAYAFAGCDSLQEVYIPNSVTEIDPFAFYSATKIRTPKLRIKTSEEIAAKISKEMLDKWNAEIVEP
jgi:hypothetical protein